MPRLLLPLSLSAAAAFAAAWGASAAFPQKTPPGLETVTSGGTAASSESSTADSRSPVVSGFALREARLQATEITDIPSIRRLLETSTPDGYALTRLARIWARQDPAGLWQWLENGGRSKTGSAELTGMVFENWFLKNPDAALAAFRAADRDLRHFASAGLLALLQTPDASVRAKLLAHLDEIVEGSYGDPLWGSSSAETVAALSALPSGTGRDRLLENAARNWMRSDWKAATAWAASLTEPRKSQLMEGMARDALIRNSQSSPSVEGQGTDRSAAESFEWIRKWLTDDAPRGLRARLGDSFVEALAKQDPDAALNWAQDNLDSRSLTKAIGGILAEQSAKDPGAARSLVESLPPGGLRQRAAFGMVSKPDAESVTWLLGQADPRDTRPWGELASKWAFENPDAYKRFVAQAAPDSLPASLRQGGLENLVRKDAPATLTWAMETGNTASASQALSIWGRQDAPAAASWLKENMADQWRSSDTSNLAANYFERSPGDAVNWALALPESPARQTAIRSLTGSLSSNQRLSVEQRNSLAGLLGGNP